MVDSSIIKIRKVTYDSSGFVQGELLQDFHGDIDEAFDHYSKKWMNEHCDNQGNLFDYIATKDADYIDEFTFKEIDHFFIGIPNSFCYEGITDEYAGYPGCKLDKYGFEKMFNSNGDEIKYFK